jgi:hypothetical protein
MHHLAFLSTQNLFNVVKMKKLKSLDFLTATLGIVIFSSIGCPTKSALAIDVRTSGNVIKNLSNQKACDVNIGFKIPGFFEKILGGAINIRGLDPVQIVNEGLSSFDKDIFFIKDGKFICVDVSEPIFVDILVDSKKKNAIQWLTQKVFLTGEGGINNPLPSELGLAGFVVEKKASNTNTINRNSSADVTTYTFSNDGNVNLFIDRITLGLSPDLIDPELYSPGLLSEINEFNNNGLGWNLAPEETITLDIPFEIPGASYLIANIEGIGNPGGNEFSVNFLQQHEEPIPEPSSSLSLLALGTLGAASTLKRKLKPSKSTEKETTKVG